MSLAKVIEVYFFIAEVNQQTVLHNIRWLILCVDALLKKIFLIVSNINSASFEVFISLHMVGMEVRIDHDDRFLTRLFFGEFVQVFTIAHHFCIDDNHGTIANNHSTVAAASEH